MGDGFEERARQTNGFRFKRCSALRRRARARCADSFAATRADTTGLYHVLPALRTTSEARSMYVSHRTQQNCSKPVSLLVSIDSWAPISARKRASCNAIGVISAAGLPQSSTAGV